MSRRIVVTGAAGLLGGFVMRALRERGETDILGLDQAPGADLTASVLDLAALRRAFEGADAVLHIAAAANIWSGSHERIVEINAQGSWSVLEAARQSGVRRVALCSSDSVLGNTVWPEFFWSPNMLPVREDHELRPADPYALSKLMAEQAGRSYSLRGVEVVALRPVFILFPSMLGEARARFKDPAGYKGPCAGGHCPAGGGLCWHHVDPRDAADAFVCAIDASWSGFAAYWIAAPSTLHPTPTLEILRERFGALPGNLDTARYQAAPFAPMYDMKAAYEGLGWRPRFDLREQVVAP